LFISSLTIDNGNTASLLDIITSLDSSVVIPRMLVGARTAPFVTGYYGPRPVLKSGFNYGCYCCENGSHVSGLLLGGGIESG
jgi:hypothetical protein